MNKPFLNKKEAYQIKLLAYKRYNTPLPLTAPAKLHVRFVDRSTKDRGIQNQEEIIEILKQIPDVSLNEREMRKMRKKSAILMRM